MKSVERICTLGELAGKYNDVELRWERGYLSRKIQITDNTSVYRSGDGRLFYYRPSHESTSYFRRCYLVHDGLYLRSI